MRFRLSAYFVLIPALITLSSGKVLAAQTAMAPEDIFEKGLGDLQEAMDKAAQDNEMISQQNSSLKRQAELLEDQIEDLKQEKAQASGETAPVVDKDLAEKENDLYKTRTKNLAARLSRFTGDKTRLLKKIAQTEKDNEDARKEIARIKEEIAQDESVMAAQTKIPQPDTDRKSDDIRRDIAVHQKNINTLEAKLAPLESGSRKKTVQRTDLEKVNDGLTSQLSGLKATLDSLLQEKKLITKENSAESGMPGPSDDELQNRIAELQDYRQALRQALTQLQDAGRRVKPAEKIDLSKTLKKLEEQNSLLKQKLVLLEPNDHPGSGYSAADTATLREIKDRLISERNMLKNKLTAAKAENSATGTGQARNISQIKRQIKDSNKRVEDLSSRIASTQKISGDIKRKTELESVVATLDKELDNLRNHTDVPPIEQEPVMPATDEKTVKENISNLQARRDILADSLTAIRAKYRPDDISVSIPGVKEAQLEEYLKALGVENNALQEKLLKLQMRADKASPAPMPRPLDKEGP